MATKRPQNGQRGLASGPPLSFWVLLSTFAMRKGRNGGNKNGGKKEDQPRGTGGTHSPPAKSKKADKGPQNGQQGLERGPILSYWALCSTFAK